MELVPVLMRWRGAGAGSVDDEILRNFLSWKEKYWRTCLTGTLTLVPKRTT